MVRVYRLCFEAVFLSLGSLSCLVLCSTMSVCRILFGCTCMLAIFCLGPVAVSFWGVTVRMDGGVARPPEARTAFGTPAQAALPVFACAKNRGVACMKIGGGVRVTGCRATGTSSRPRFSMLPCRAAPQELGSMCASFGRGLVVLLWCAPCGRCSCRVCACNCAAEASGLGRADLCLVFVLVSLCFFVPRLVSIFETAVVDWFVFEIHEEIFA